MTWFIWILIAIAYAHLSEYAIHRWAMHRPWPWRHWYYTDHAIEHHARERTDTNIEVMPWTIAAVGWPLAVGYFFLGWQWLAFLATLFCVYSAVWTIMHSAIHGVSGLWLRSVPGFSFWQEHHREHHRQPNKNFGTVFPWTDYLFRTKA